MILVFLKLYNTIKINPIIIIMIGLFIFSCSSDKDHESLDDIIIAKVGDRIISAGEFKSSFEFSFAPFRTGSNPREVYLNYMIKELLISNEGFSQGFNNSQYVKSRYKNRLNNNLLQSFYAKYVHGKVNIPDKEIEEATKRATIKFRLMIWPVPSLEDGNNAYREASKSGLEDYVEKQITKLEIKNVDKKYFETDWLDFLDLRPELLAEIQNLEMGKTSTPIPYNGGYALFQLLGINREPIKSDELKYGARRKKIRARLFNIESDKIIHNLMDSVLTPLDVRAKNKTIDQIVEPLYSWVRAGIPEYGTIVQNLKEASDTSQSYILELKKLLPELLVTTINEKITVEDYFNYMNYHRRIINLSQSPLDMKNRLVTEIGNMIKNNTFISIAEKENFQDSIRIVRDMKLWEQKWTYDSYRKYLVDNIEIAEDEMKSYFKDRWKELSIAEVDSTRFYHYENDVYNVLLFEKQTELLDKELAELKERYPVWINEEALNNLELSDGPQTMETSLFATKNFTGEKIVPDADMKWLHF